MKKGYIRLSADARSLEAQREALAAVGVPASTQTLFVDEAVSDRRKLGGRRLAIHSLVPGDELAVASAGRLGISAEDILAALVDILNKGAAVFDAETGETVGAGTDALAALGFAARASLSGRREKARRLQEGRNLTKRTGGAPPKPWKVSEERARELWGNPALSASDVAAAAGTSVPTLYRRLGGRGDNAK